MELKAEIFSTLDAAVEALQQAGEIAPGGLIVLGCSTSEVAGGRIGKNSVPELGDAIAETMIDTCRALGLRIPEEISIVGFDDMPLCRYARPPLTTVRQDRMNLGKSAFAALSALLSGIPLSTMLLRAELIKRSSCAAPKK